MAVLPLSGKSLRRTPAGERAATLRSDRVGSASKSGSSGNHFGSTPMNLERPIASASTHDSNSPARPAGNEASAPRSSSDSIQKRLRNERRGRDREQRATASLSPSRCTSRGHDRCCPSLQHPPHSQRTGRPLRRVPYVRKVCVSLDHDHHRRSPFCHSNESGSTRVGRVSPVMTLPSPGFAFAATSNSFTEDPARTSVSSPDGRRRRTSAGSTRSSEAFLRRACSQTPDVPSAGRPARRPRELPNDLTVKREFGFLENQQPVALFNRP